MVVWSYPRGGGLSKSGETALDVVAYAAHIAALMGAHIIKVKPPADHIEQQEAKKYYEDQDFSTLESRIAHVIKSAFDGRRIVIFSGGAAKGEEAVVQEIGQIAAGGGFGSIIGRNAFQRPKAEAHALLDKIATFTKKRLPNVPLAPYPAGLRRCSPGLPPLDWPGR